MGLSEQVPESVPVLHRGLAGLGTAGGDAGLAQDRLTASAGHQDQNSLGGWCLGSPRTTGCLASETGSVGEAEAGKVQVGTRDFSPAVGSPVASCSVLPPRGLLLRQVILGVQWDTGPRQLADPASSPHLGDTHIVNHTGSELLVE